MHATHSRLSLAAAVAKWWLQASLSSGRAETDKTYCKGKSSKEEKHYKYKPTDALLKEEGGGERERVRREEEEVVAA